MRVLILGSKEYPMGTNTGDPCPSGGIEVYTENLINELLNFDVEVSIISRRFAGAPEYERVQNLHIYRVPWIKGHLLRNPTFNFISFVKAMSLDYDVILCNGPISSFFGVLLSKLKKRPIIMCPSGIAWVQPQYNVILKKLLRQLEIFTYSHGDCIVFLSKQDQFQFEKKLGFLPQHSDVIPTGVNLSDFNNPLSWSRIDEFGLQGSRVITFVGRLIEVKGVNYLIDAINLVKSNDYKLLIVGSGTECEHLLKQTESLGLQDKIIFTGFRTYIPEILSITDIFVLPSLSEGLPIALLEAMAAGCACIVTDIGLPVENLVTGLVVSPKNPPEIADAIDALLEDPALMEYLGNNARAYVEENHSWKNVGTEYMQLFQRLHQNQDYSPHENRL